MSLANWSFHHRRFVLFLLALGAIAGAISALNLPVALFPHIEFPRIAILLDAGDRPASQMVTEVTKPVEQAVKSVPGVRELRSNTGRGGAELSLNFDWGSNMDNATLQVQAEINRLLPTLPQGTTFDVRRMNPTALYPVTAYGMISDKLDPVALRDIAKNDLVPQLSAVTGVASVEIQGGQTREIHVDVDPGILSMNNLSLDDIKKSLTVANVLEVSGKVEDRHKLLLVLADTQKLTLDDIKHIVVSNGDNGVVELQNVAHIDYGVEPEASVVKEDGKTSVVLQIFQQPDGNTVQIVKDVNAAIEQAQKKLPPGIQIKNWYDQSELILQSASSVRDSILIGILLAGVVLFVFLRNIQITLAAIIVVPAVLATTVLLLKVLGMSFNIMTLGGMAAAIGLIIDDAIVMIEQIVRHVKNDDGKREDTIRHAVQSFISPMAGSSASTIVIFIPLAFLSGVTGAFFKSLALTMASALIVSFFIAWFVIPLLADYLLKSHKEDKEGRFMPRILASYRTTSTKFLGRPLLLLIPVLLLLGGGYLSYLNVGSGFMPAMDEGGFILDYVAPPGTSVTDTDAILSQIDGILKETPEVTTWSRRTGEQLGGGLTEMNTGDFFVRLKPDRSRDIEEIMTDLREQITQKVPGIDIEMAQLMEDMIGDLTAVPQPIEIQLSGNDPTLLQKTAEDVTAAISKVQGVVDTNNGIVLAGDALDIQIDPALAGLEGLDPQAVSDQLKSYLSGSVATTIQNDIKTIAVRVWIPQELRSRTDKIKELPIKASDGHVVSLGRIASVKLLTAQPEIARNNLKNIVAVTGRIEGRDLGSTVKDVEKVLNGQNLLPKTVSYTLGGLYAQQQIAFHDLIIVISAAFALVFLLLLYLYENFSMALSIIMMPLLAMAAVFVGLFLTGIELNISAMMGMTMVVGIVTEVAIFFFSEYTELARERGYTSATLTEAGSSRFRPIAMTTLAAILALLPLALGLGQGAEMQRPLAIAIISGLIVQMPLVLLIMPTIYSMLAKIKQTPRGENHV